MANSDFWRDLAVSFQSIPKFHDFSAFRQYYMELSTVEPIWNIEAAPTVLAEFDSMGGWPTFAPPRQRLPHLSWFSKGGHHGSRLPALFVTTAA